MLEVILGGMTGLAGSIATAFVNYKVQKLNNLNQISLAKIELEKMDKEKDFMLAEAQVGLQISEAQSEAQIEFIDAQAYGDSIKKAQQNAVSEKLHNALVQSGMYSKAIGNVLAFGYGLIEFIKRILRPGLTLYLVALTTWVTYIAWQVLQLNNDKLSGDQVFAIYDNASMIVVYLTVTCVTWWFGDRRMAKYLTRLNDGNIKNNANFTGGKPRARV